MRVRIDAFPNPHPALRATLSRRARDKHLQDRVTSKSDKTPANERNSHKKAQKAHKEPLPYVLFVPFCGYFPLRVSDFDGALHPFPIILCRDNLLGYSWPRSIAGMWMPAG